MKIDFDHTEEEKIYEFAKLIFFQEEGRVPNINNTKDCNAIAILCVGITHTLQNLNIK